MVNTIVAKQTRVFVNPTSSKLLNMALIDANAYILTRALTERVEAQTDGDFPDDDKQIKQFHRTRGGERRRDQPLATWNPKYLKLPFAVRMTREGTAEEVWKATDMAFDMANRIAPRRSGVYAMSINVYYNKIPTSIGTIKELIETGQWKPTDVARVVAVAPYSGWLEAYYTVVSGRRGLLYGVANSVKQSFGPKIALRFTYTLSSEMGVSYPGGRTYYLPTIEIGLAGAFAENNTRPGKNLRRRRSRARRQGRIVRK